MDAGLFITLHRFIKPAPGSLSVQNVTRVLQIVYIAPMKALAAEMVRNFGKKLEPLGISVRELTGDMQLTKDEIMRTQVRCRQTNASDQCIVLCSFLASSF